MDILLTEDVAGVGDIGETVKVKAGYARNFLIPQGFAVEAHAGSSKAIAHRLKQLEAKRSKLKVEAEQAAKKWSSMTVVTSLKVAGKGKVFGSITTRDIVELLKKQHNIEIDRRRILLSDPLKKLGTHTVAVKLHAEVQSSFSVQIDKAQASEEDIQKAVDETRQNFAQTEAVQVDDVSEEQSSEV